MALGIPGMAFRGSSSYHGIHGNKQLLHRTAFSGRFVAGWAASVLDIQNKIELVLLVR
jgi:hypothetical protein